MSYPTNQPAPGGNGANPNPNPNPNAPQPVPVSPRIIQLTQPMSSPKKPRPTQPRSSQPSNLRVSLTAVDDARLPVPSPMTLDKEINVFERAFEQAYANRPSAHIGAFGVASRSNPPNAPVTREEIAEKPAEEVPERFSREVPGEKSENGEGGSADNITSHPRSSEADPRTAEMLNATVGTPPVEETRRASDEDYLYGAGPAYSSGASPDDDEEDV
ncbi:uncharacterized protein BCR38DRAFT_487348 [Pseudomassariella vexata]|uniref:Uncharacterized protein n=1 Tax=Pseudomassariella vexata TaxID=1141098 RepID=A0A1Y2DQQ6_9PEZI|nr:uncharacterized protein BCR38DRAFT_487348 [Pseudomassariella vexata]ORY61600.1 hypothetical protein BCR38DRAFT_487348 [Pseudomassariella vexata]